MKVKGIEISDDQIETAFHQMSDEFHFMGMIGSLCRNGVPYDVADRCADRILQKKRLAGEIVHEGGKWRRVAGEAAR